MNYPNYIFTGFHGPMHIQGIAVDKANKYLYCSFTNKLVKLDLDGNLIGSVTGLTGHLGCIEFSEEDGLVYGSLEYKADLIGSGIRAKLGIDTESAEGFYIAIFDPAEITRPDMDAFAESVMTAAFCPEPTEDYKAIAANGEKHRFGCSGIDGVSIGPDFGADRDSKRYLNVMYGVYNDVNREDNDYQVMIQYDIAALKAAAKPLDQENMHTSGTPCRNKYFIFTGNTNYGVQNLEYDEFSSNWFMAVYPGKKEIYPNNYMFVIDGRIPPKEEILRGHGDMRGLTLTLAGEGCRFPLGSTGMASLDDGRFYMSKVRVENGLHSGEIYLHRLTDAENGNFEKIGD